ncbi:DUF3617 domain-containing protein [Aliidiomarina soli]|uniref:DUF3617 domain-containing protein n=1 Tax=Aliidiomarina soli TaxID=1928574 RepID=A0A432WIH3_9GAMM|nr:DUF3617 domain-containing protein [Aliidiomarina soli]RUO33622.1 DUF3617 domain-containing protein [Aliidiomarina soli]
MNRNSTLGLTMALVLGSLSTATAEDELDLDIRPGLWEHSFSMQSESGQMERAIEEALQQLEQLPQSQRRMVEQMMSSQGINLDLAGSSVQVCLTEDDIRRGNLPQQDGCDQTITQQGDTYHFSFQCAGDPPYEGRGQIVVLNNEQYEGNAEFTTRMAGNPETIQIRQQGRWLREECN